MAKPPMRRGMGMQLPPAPPAQAARPRGKPASSQSVQGMTRGLEVANPPGLKRGGRAGCAMKMGGRAGAKPRQR